MPKLSIITINFNNAKGLERTIKSVVAQENKDLEYIVIDGNSTDTSVAIIKEFEPHISTWISEPDTGVYQAMNKGISMATGAYLLFLNSGDHFYTEDTLNKIYSDITEKELISFSIRAIGQGVDIIKEHPQELNFSFLYKDTLAHQSTFIKRSLFTQVGVYDEALQITSDWKFFLLAAVRHNCSYKSVSEVLSTYYLDGKSATAEGTNIRKKEREQILKSEFSLFYSDYKKLELFNLNRFKMLLQLEQSKTGRKLATAMLTILSKCFKR